MGGTVAVITECLIPVTGQCAVGCGRRYHIVDYHNGITTYQIVSEETDDNYLKTLKHEKVLNLSFYDLSNWQEFLDSKGNGTLECMVTFVVDFGDKGEGHVEIDIKVCDGGDSTPYIDAVLIQDGNAVGCLDVRDELAGEYRFEGFLNSTYVAIIPDVDAPEH